MSEALIGSRRRRYRKITPEDLWSEKKTFRPKSIPGLRSTESGLCYTVLEDKTRIVRYSYETGEPLETVFDAAWFKPRVVKEVEAYDLSKDEARVLLSTKSKRVHSHWSTADWYVWDREPRSPMRLSRQPGLRLATFSPDGGKVAFVSRNNLFIRDLASGEELQVTGDGRAGSIINGAADWVYEEEFGLARAYQWSPDGAYLAYARFDESRVRAFTLLRYDGGYPQRITYKYPRAGERNAVVSVHVYDLARRESRTVDIGEESDQYIPRIKWTETPGLLAVLRLNRLQNRLVYLLCNTVDGSSRVLHIEENDRYVEVDDSLTFLDDREHFIILSERSGWRHIHLHDMRGRGVRQITAGDWDITKFHGYDQENQRLYFTAARPTPLHRSVYSIKLDGTDELKLTPDDGWNSASFSTGCRYFINTHSDASTQPVVSLHDGSGNRVRVLEDNKALRDTLQHYRIGRKEFFTFATSEGVQLNGWMIKPPNFDESRRYPVLMTVYGGPDSQTVTEGWGVGWDHYLAQEGYVIASVDGRGTGGRGEEFRKCTYLQLGKLEVADQIEGARYLGALPYVDASRIGIFGWSYGGFMAASCILRGPDTFKAAIAVAPVTSYRYYDTIYTERYMRTPRENPDGYDGNAPVAYAENLKGKLLLVHGGADDNVHYQNSLELVEALVKAGKQFEVHFLPNRDHGISGGNTELHLFRRMTDFLRRNL